MLFSSVIKYLNSFGFGGFGGYFSSPGPKTQVSFSGQICPLSVVVVIVVLVVNFHNFNFFSRTTRPISIKLGTKHSWMKGIQVCLYEGPRPFQGQIKIKED